MAWPSEAGCLRRPQSDHALIREERQRRIRRSLAGDPAAEDGGAGDSAVAAAVDSIDGEALAASRPTSRRIAPSQDGAYRVSWIEWYRIFNAEVIGFTRAHGGR